MIDTLNILVLHRMGDPLYWRSAVRDLEYLLPDHATSHRYIVHAADQPLPPYIKDLKFHGIVLGPTFLCARSAPHTFAAVSTEYDFVRTSDAFKVALPQDDYDCHAILDRWMRDWNVDVVYAACSEHWDVLYPGYSRTGRIRQGFTGYVADSWIAKWQHPTPLDERSIDVSYRARRLPPNFGRIGQLKSVIGDRFAAHPATAGLKLDISTDPEDLIAGAPWHAFLNASKFCLATSTGSSVLDPDGEIQRCVEQFMIRHPHADFEDVEVHCFPGQDGNYSFTAISPRNLEAALAQTVQIATPGAYSGVLRAAEHYIQLDPDCSNARDVVEQMRDRTSVERIATHARQAVLDRSELRASHHASTLIQQIADGAAEKRVQRETPERIIAAERRYQADVLEAADNFWAARRRRARIRNVAVALGARRLKRWLLPN